MNRVAVTIPGTPTNKYFILMDNHLVNAFQKCLPASYRNIVIITDNKVKAYYANTLAAHIKKSGKSVLLLAFPPGEKSKNNKTKQAIENQMLKQRCGREDTLILAIGGGVVGDLAGFIAATYMRGIPFIQIPTTLLAMVDSSIGGKTGINTPYGKNLIGAFWQPLSVVADVNCLTTLPKKHLINGLIEALKMFLTHDAPSFHYAKRHINEILACEPLILTKIIKRAVKIKANIVQRDEKEKNERMVLNFGHTIGHALEKASHYKILHGYAVAFGILVEAKIAELLGFLKESDYLTIETLFKQLGIHGKTLKPFNTQEIVKLTKTDKKTKQGNTRYILLKNIGKTYQKKQLHAHVVKDELVIQAFLQVSGV